MHNRTKSAEETLLHTQRLKHCICWICVKARLELGEQFARYRRNIFDTGHRKQNTLCSSIECHLQRFSKVLDRYNVATKTHTAEDNHLRLKWFAEDTRAKCHECRECQSRSGTGVVQFHHMQMVVVIASFDRCTDATGI